MALYVKQENEQTKLQEKVAAQLRERSYSNSLAGEGNGKNPEVTTDLVEDSAYLENSKETTSLSLVWLLLFIAVVIAIVYFLIFS